MFGKASTEMNGFGNAEQDQEHSFISGFFNLFKIFDTALCNVDI